MALLTNSQSTSPLRVAIVDTGIDPSHPGLAEVVEGVHLEGGDHDVRSNDQWKDMVGHGTACAGIVSRGLRARIQLMAVRVVDGDRGSDPRVLADAIHWSTEHGARVINVSLGAESWKNETCERLEAACQEAVARGAVIVAAAGPEGKTPLPAALPDVISVGTAYCPSDVLYAADEGHIQFLARGDLQRVAWTNGSSVLAQGTSLAAAHVSRAVCKILLAAPALHADGVRDALAAQCVQGDPGFRQQLENSFAAFFRRRTPAHVGFIRKAALYPFNKEMHALVRFRDLAPFTLAAVADPAGNRQAGRDAAEAIGDAAAGLCIRPDLDGALDQADTLILGHIEAARTTARHGLPAIVHRAVAQGRNVFSLSRVDPDEHADLFRLAEQKGVTIADPTLTRAEVAPIFRAAGANPVSPRKAGGRLFSDDRLQQQARAFLRGAVQVQRYDCPVLGVFGTSRAQGKFSVQLALRRALREMGYRVAHLATEPTGALLGASATVPLGHEHGDHLGLEIYERLIRMLITAIKNQERPDLLLVGGQSGVVSFNRDIDRLSLGSMGALTLGGASQPDACVLVCNVFDPPKHVRRCIAAIESVLDCRVLALALNDQVWEQHTWRDVSRARLARLPETALRECARERSAELGLPCHAALGTDGVARLAEIAVEFFACADQGEVEIHEPWRDSSFGDQANSD